MSSSIVWAVDTCQDVLEFYRILWQALVARQEAFMLHLYSYICLQQLVAELGFLEFHDLVPRTKHVHQCKSAKHNKRILLCTNAKALNTISASFWTRAPMRQPWLSVRRVYSACSALVRLWTQSCGCVTLKSCMENHIL